MPTQYEGATPRSPVLLEIVSSTGWLSTWVPDRCMMSSLCPGKLRSCSTLKGPRASVTSLLYPVQLLLASLDQV